MNYRKNRNKNLLVFKLYTWSTAAINILISLLFIYFTIRDIDLFIDGLIIVALVIGYGIVRSSYDMDVLDTKKLVSEKLAAVFDFVCVLLLTGFYGGELYITLHSTKYLITAIALACVEIGVAIFLLKRVFGK